MCGRYYVDDETAEEIEKVIRLEIMAGQEIFGKRF